MNVQPSEQPLNLQVPNGKIAIVASRFNAFIVDKLIKGAENTLRHYGLKAENLKIYQVPGAFEIPLVCQKIAQSGQYCGIVALGAVIRGDTPHFDYVSKACTDGVLQAQLATQVPIAFGVLTTDNLEQAQDRADGKMGNKGSEAAIALLETIQLLETLHA